MVGAPGFEPGTPRPPVWCAIQAALRPEPPRGFARSPRNVDGFRANARGFRGACYHWEMRGFLGAVLLGLVAFGCSSGSGDNSGSTGTGSGSCAATCQKVGSLGCPVATDVAACTSDCQDSTAKYQSVCGSVVGAYLSCISHVQPSCQPSGNGGYSIGQITGSCPSQYTAYAKCIACTVVSSDDSCEQCAKTSCCNELEAVFSDPDFGAYADCFNACSDSACRDACEAEYPGVQSGYTNLINCELKQCANC